MPQKTRTAARAPRNTMDEKLAAIESMLAVLKSDEYRLLTNYMYLGPKDLKVYVDITEDGEYVLTVRAVTDRLIDIGRVV